MCGRSLGITETLIESLAKRTHPISNGLIYVMNDTGLLTLIEATPAGYKQLAQSQVLTGYDSWGPMALAGGRLIVRDMTRMVCLDVRGKK